MRTDNWQAGLGAPIDVMAGEDRRAGRIYAVRTWHSWSDQAKVKFLRQMAKDYAADPEMRWFTVQSALRAYGAPPNDNRAQAAAILKYVQEQMYYANEEGEQIQSPWRTIAVRTGDCDDLALLTAAMAGSIGLGWRFALAGKRNGRPVRWIEGQGYPRGEFSHIYVQIGWPALHPEQWASAEPTLRGAPLGYDVIVHGPPQGRRDLPTYAGPELILNNVVQPTADPVQMPDLAALQAPRPAEPARAAPPANAGAARSFALEVLQGVVVSLIVASMIEKGRN